MRRTTTIAALCVALTGLAAPAAADARFRVQNKLFDVQVKGYQLTTWSHDHPSRGGCDSNRKGGGREVMRFTSKKVRLRGMWVGGFAPTFSGAKLGVVGKIPLRTRITRSGEMQNWGGQICSYGDGTGGQKEKPKDCGTKYSNALRTTLEYDPASKTSLGLGRDFGNPDDVFENCPAGPLMWPKAQVLSAKGKRLGRRMSYRRLFNGDQQHILRMGSVVDNTTFETPARTEVGWQVTITRVVKKKK
ncbi:MAG TPA: hypothetical protein VEX39_09620 [Thermoleophilaceae bacterium]|nr:hypothetical protein [Thermoleophilaceae bacterium]